MNVSVRKVWNFHSIYDQASLLEILQRCLSRKWTIKTPERAVISPMSALSGA